MQKQVESLPEARLLLMSLRSVDYTEETAIADIIDNSISAESSDINVRFDWERKLILIIDNGIGMDEEFLWKNNSMCFVDCDGAIQCRKRISLEVKCNAEKREACLFDEKENVPVRVGSYCEFAFYLPSHLRNGLLD